MFMKKKQFIFTSLFLAAILMTACTEVEEGTTEEQTGDQSTETEQSGDVSSLIISADTVSEQGGCVLSSRYSAGDKIIFRGNIVDGATGEQVADAKAQVELSTGEVLDMAYGEHGDDHFWVVAYPITEDTPTGSLDYKITASYNDVTANFEPFNVQPSKLQIVSDTVAVSAPAQEPQEEVDLSKVETNQNVDIVAVNFEFKGPNNEKEFYVKAGEEVTLTLKSDEGAHGLAIPNLNVNLEKDGEVKFIPEKTGEYQIACSVFCGAGHGDMTAKLVVVE
jgi:heme/copper-type cytochrome/quinol oxidase subunit 2